MSFLVPYPLGNLQAASLTTLNSDTEEGLYYINKKWSLAFGLS